MFSIANPDFIQKLISRACCFSRDHLITKADDLRLISRRLIVAFLLSLLRLLSFIVFVENFQIFHIIPDAKVGDRAQQDEEGGREVQQIAQRLAVVLPAVAGAIASPAPHQASPALGNTYIRAKP